ncbi:MAG: sulfite exporter TauE/SafE family protein [Alphaproteobacteria bacterium]
MNIYLPIAEMSVNIFLILGLGAVTGVLSGLFGVGGGFLITPLLMFIGVPPTVSVASAANQIVASSLSGFMGHWRRGNVDFKMGGFLLAGGFVGSTLGVGLFRWLKDIGQIDLIISVSYVSFLGVIGAMMAGESIRSILKVQKKSAAAETARLAHQLPFKVLFPRSKIEISAIMPVCIGFFVGIMVSLMGIGGGFFLIPAMIYLLGMPTSIVIGTSLFQIIFITANVTLLQAITTQTVDVILALLLLTGAVFGAQFGSSLSTKLPAEYLRGLLALMVIVLATKLAFNLFTPPDNIYSVSVLDD